MNWVPLVVFGIQLLWLVWLFRHDDEMQGDHEVIPGDGYIPTGGPTDG